MADNSVNVKSLRMLRAIRALKTLKAFPSMRRLVSTLLRALPDLGNSAVFTLFMACLMAILGLQQFAGVQYFRCRTTPRPVGGVWPKSPEAWRICSNNTNGGGGDYECPS